MSPAASSLLALLIAIALSIVSRMNVGLIALAFAWLVGVYVAGLTPEKVIGGFPSTLFITLAGVTLLFAAAEENGTLERLAHRAAGLARGDARWLPLIFFVIAAVVSSVGPGAISSVALVAPLAMAIGAQAAVPPFLTALMVANGANAGNLSPVSSVGVIANNAMAKVGLGGHEGQVFFANFAAHLLVAVGAYVLLGGSRLRGAAVGAPEASSVASAEVATWRVAAEENGGVAVVAPPTARAPALVDTSLNAKQRLTVAVILAWIAAVLLLKVNVGLSAFGAVAVLLAARAVQDASAIKRMPWSVIVMVCGVTVLIAVLEATKGMDLFTGLLARLATGSTVNGAIAFVTGVISTWSSTSGVVLPAFLPTAPGLVSRVGGGDPLAVALSINVGSSIVDVSPLSTLGALCLAALPAGESADRLFRQLLIWGLAMAVVGAVLCQVFAGVVAGS